MSVSFVRAVKSKYFDVIVASSPVSSSRRDRGSGCVERKTGSRALLDGEVLLAFLLLCRDELCRDEFFCLFFSDSSAVPVCTVALTFVDSSACFAFDGSETKVPDPVWLVT